MMFFVTGLFAFFWVMSLWAFLAFVRDKERAVRGDWRVPETTLLLLAFLGGWPGAKLAQRRFRHKTRKEPFRTLLNLCAAGPVLIAALAAAAWARPGAVAGLAGAVQGWASGIVGG
ncbi:MAG: hypothetical protein RIR62_1695 [Pseudomonadota bacterium]|jgi:uncharacterized membrane protein YsdA (DUF1294 family)